MKGANIQQNNAAEMKMAVEYCSLYIENNQAWPCAREWISGSLPVISFMTRSGTNELNRTTGTPVLRRVFNAQYTASGDGRSVRPTVGDHGVDVGHQSHDGSDSRAAVLF
jgi:hypothetical protein